jgi:hypothetical protein
MPKLVWIQPLESDWIFPRSNITHLGVALDESLFRCVRLARAWFAASPEPSLEFQGFRTQVNLFKHSAGNDPSGVHLEQPFSLKPTLEPIDHAALHASRNAVWFEVRTRHGEVFTSPKVAIDALPSAQISDPPIDGEEQTTQVTLTLEITIKHEGEFGKRALEELIGNLDAALNAQRDASGLAPESVDGVTEDFVFCDLEVRRKETQ